MSEKIYIRSCKTVRADGTIVITPWRQVVKLLDPEVKERNKQLRAERKEIKKQAQLEERSKIKEIKKNISTLINKLDKASLDKLLLQLQQPPHAPEKA
jgi:hypothetical protein